MKRYTLLLALMLVGLSWACRDGSAQDASSRGAGPMLYQEDPPAPEPGFKWVREVRYKEEQYPICKRVPDKRYKWVYATRPDYYCLPPCPIRVHHGKCDEDECPDCQGPFSRPQLKKMQIEMNCGWKCVVEYVKYKVPYIGWRKVPIDAKEAEEERPREKLPRPTPPPPPKPMEPR